ncbi:L domain-like protein [Punctularia strigosozonata HHB-11173 SS5]|uniref:L domain-like protein n=1 Tax=Punctularia strigosozonata (strain HHB-11173) TaxID=741275 RepID=UPI0004417925|nr:L domain-like protein [Punctularia strigosozonata HHB-11173 SS5]EIN09950.1 L domain-like protein [Punctularia strigosozonata HHB-11173 SS5]
MSRIPQPSSSRTPNKPIGTSGTLTPSKSRSNLRAPSPLKPSGVAKSPATPKRLPATPIKSKPSISSLKKSPSKPSMDASRETPETLPKPALSIREQIALKRAEAKKAMTSSKGGSGDDFFAVPDSPAKGPAGEEDALGRWSVRETIERARSSGLLNISSRSLPCIPSALYEIHLGVTPEPLKLVPNEPSLPSPSEDSSRSRRGGETLPSWYDSHDLEVIKAGNNEILEIQPEIVMFGSLKSIDLHLNKLAKLPNSFADLMALTTLDLSHNQLASLPANLFALPNLVTLNVSHNSLTSLPFSAPFSAKSDIVPGQLRSSRDGGSLFAPVVERAKQPLPRLLTLDASHNQITTDSIDHESGAVPRSLAKFDLSGNPLGGGSWQGASLIRALGALRDLRELLLERAEISDDAFPPDLFTSANAQPSFPSLRRLDLGETKVTEGAVRSALDGKVPLKITFQLTTGEVPAGMLQVSVGKKVVKEPWEIEAELRAKAKKERGASPPQPSEIGADESAVPRAQPQKEQWEIEAEQGLNTAGAQRRMRAAAVAASGSAQASSNLTKPPVKKTEVMKEPWEIEAEQGLLAAGTRRRVRALAAENNKPASAGTSPERSSPTGPSSPDTIIASSQYYQPRTQSLKLPPCQPPTRNGLGHARNFSLAPSRGQTVNPTELALPTATLPLALIYKQEFSKTLRTLELAHRRMDQTFDLPLLSSGEPALLALEELILEGCRLSDAVSVTQDGCATRAPEPLLPLLATLFPNLQTLDLSCNAITSAALTPDALKTLILATDSRKGLRRLHLRENRLDNLDGFASLSELFRGNRLVPEWKMEELDVRDNAVDKLPPELGLLSLDVFLVSGNTFRVPPSRVWEREGTKGLLSWLRGRIE